MRKARVALALGLALGLVSSVVLAQKGTTKGTPKKDEPAGKTEVKAEPKSDPKADEKAGEKPDEKADETSRRRAERKADKEKDEVPLVESASDVSEKPGKTYYFIGLRYGGTVIPKFMLNIFVNEGKTVFSNTLGLELDIRKDDFSFIPSLSYTEYGTGDMLFMEKNKPDIPGNWSMVNSSMKAMYLGADLLWSTKVATNLDLEYGAGFGLGVLFGDLVNNWVYPDPNGPLTSADGSHKFSPCRTVNDGEGCAASQHSGATVAKVNGYTEASWASGGSKPNIFPRINWHIVGLRIKPMKQMEARLGVGFSLTEGFWFGASGNYGLERPDRKTGSSSGVPELRWH